MCRNKSWKCCNVKLHLTWVNIDWSIGRSEHASCFSHADYCPCQKIANQYTVLWYKFHAQDEWIIDSNRMLIKSWKCFEGKLAQHLFGPKLPESDSWGSTLTTWKDVLEISSNLNGMWFSFVVSAGDTFMELVRPQELFNGHWSQPSNLRISITLHYFLSPSKSNSCQSIFISCIHLIMNYVLLNLCVRFCWIRMIEPAFG